MFSKPWLHLKSLFQRPYLSVSLPKATVGRRRTGWSRGTHNLQLFGHTIFISCHLYIFAHSLASRFLCLCSVLLLLLILCCCCCCCIRLSLSLGLYYVSTYGLSVCLSVCTMSTHACLSVRRNSYSLYLSACEPSRLDFPVSLIDSVYITEI